LPFPHYLEANLFGSVGSANWEVDLLVILQATVLDAIRIQYILRFLEADLLNVT
jgi:hypothetical protein